MPSSAYCEGFGNSSLLCVQIKGHCTIFAVVFIILIVIFCDSVYATCTFGY